MKNGFDAAPSVLLARLNIDLQDPTMVQKGINVLKAKVAELARENP